MRQKEPYVCGDFRLQRASCAQSKESVKKIERVFVKPVMVTGDHIITAAAFAKGAGLIKKETECISFHELTACSDEELLEAIDTYKVFAAATSADRERLVRVLCENGRNVIVAGEQMTAPSVALYANSSFGDETMEDCDVRVKKCDIENVAETIYKARSTRGNLAYASFVAISIGFAEALVMLFMLMCKNTALPSTAIMLCANLFVVFVPALVISVFATVHQKTRQTELLAVRSALWGVVCALFALLAKDMIAFVIFASLFDGARVCAMYKNLEKGRWGIFGLVVLAVAFVASIIVLKPSVYLLLFALLAAAINAVIPYIKLKGLKK